MCVMNILSHGGIAFILNGRSLIQQVCFFDDNLCVPVPQRRGGTLIISYIRRLGPFFGVKFFNFNIFLGMKTLWIFFRGHPKIGLVLGVISMYFRVFS